MNFFKYRPMILVSIFLIAGIVLSYFGNLILVLITAIFIFLISCKFINQKILVIVFLFYFIGCSLIFFEEYKFNSSFSVSNWNGKENLEVTGVIVENLQNLRVNTIYFKPLLINNSKVKYGKIELDKRYLPVEVEAGEIYSGKFSLREPMGHMNPGDFSYKKFMRKKGIFSKGYFESEFSYRGRNNFKIKYLLVNMKKKMMFIIDNKIYAPYNNIVMALLLGERHNLPENWEEKFTLSGTNHLLAISGLHIGFILVILLQLTRILNLSNIKLKNSLISIILIFYIFITGFRASVFRAAILAIFYLWANFFNREADIFNIIAITAIINLLIKPYSLFEVGFQLSYIVLITIMLWLPYFKKILPEVLSVSISAQLGSFAITSYYFNLISPIGIVTNLWAIPLTGLIIIASIFSLILTVIFPLFTSFLNLFLKILFSLLYKGMEYTSEFSLGSFEMATPDLWLVIFFYFVLFFSSFLFKKRSIKILQRKNSLKRKVLIISIILILIINFAYKPAAKLEIVFFYIGQGDSILLNLPNGEKILVDGGGKAGMKSNYGKVVLEPYLKHKGIKKIDLAIITHFDTDHALGINYLLKENRVKSVLIPQLHADNYLSKNAYKLADEKNIKIHRVKRGDFIQKGKVHFSVIHPYLKNHYSNSSKNNNSIVIRLKYYNFTLLLTGDLEEEGELRLINSEDNLKSAIIKIGHHGSKGSSSLRFLKKVNENEESLQ